MVTGTGCLGLSLRTTIIIAAVITTIQSIAWVGLSSMGYLIYSCTYAFTPSPDLKDLGLRLGYILYLLDPSCHSLDSLSPAGVSEHITLDGGEISTATRTSKWAISYIIISFLWIFVSLLLLAAQVGRVPGRVGAKLSFPWIVVTASTLFVDLAAMGTYATDCADFNTLDDVRRVSNVNIPASWVSQDANLSLVLKTGPLILLAFFLRGVLLWLLNGVLLVHVVRAVRGMMKEEDEPVDKEPSDGDQPVQQPTRKLTPHPMVTPELVNALPAAESITSTPSSRRPAASYSPPGGVRVLPGRLSERMSSRSGDRSSERAGEREDDRQPTKGEIINRLERMSHLRTSGRSSPDDRSQRIEAQINNIIKRMNSDSSMKSAPVSSRPDNRFHDLPREGVPPAYTRVQSHEEYPQIRRVQEYDDAPRRRHRDTHKLERAYSDLASSAAGSEWRMGHRPPGNLHSLSPTQPPLRRVDSARLPGHSHHADHPHQEATDVLKRELPWTYIKTVADHDLHADSRTPQGSSPKVIRNMYLPPRRGEETLRHSAASNGLNRSDQFSRDVLY